MLSMDDKHLAFGCLLTSPYKLNLSTSNFTCGNNLNHGFSLYILSALAHVPSNTIKFFTSKSTSSIPIDFSLGNKSIDPGGTTILNSSILFPSISF
ncbi:hypothetical protein HanRHA438_Chr08g0363761 [Helianthus annuus]|nr:hypothetical protein HanRHA438_Chr08g0363761 [Helianthus annuus]